MDILAGLSPAMALPTYRIKVGTAMLGKAMDTNEAPGARTGTDDRFRSHGARR